MQLNQAERKQAKIKMGLQGAAGSGKTYSALKIAFGLTQDWKKIAVIDTESGSANLYSDLGNYYVLALSEPFSPVRYIEALKICENAGIECVIIDSVSHEWSGKGGCLQLHEEATAAMRIPNSFTAWASVTPKHQAFIDAILQSKCHVITTLRTKTEYIITERNGKNVPQKVGMAAVQRDGFEFELSISLDLDDEHYALPSKDRTGLFSDKGKFRITSETGKTIAEWCNLGKSLHEVKTDIQCATTVDELRNILKTYPNYRTEIESLCIERKNELESPISEVNINPNYHGT